MIPDDILYRTVGYWSKGKISRRRLKMACISNTNYIFFTKRKKSFPFIFLNMIQRETIFGDF